MSEYLYSSFPDLTPIIVGGISFPTGPIGILPLVGSNEIEIFTQSTYTATIGPSEDALSLHTGIDATFETQIPMPDTEDFAASITAGWGVLDIGFTIELENIKTTMDIPALTDEDNEDSFYGSAQYLKIGETTLEVGYGSYAFLAKHGDSSENPETVFLSAYAAVASMAGLVNISTVSELTSLIVSAHKEVLSIDGSSLSNAKNTAQAALDAVKNAYENVYASQISQALFAQGFEAFTPQFESLFTILFDSLQQILNDIYTVTYTLNGQLVNINDLNDIGSFFEAGEIYLDKQSGTFLTLGLSPLDTVSDLEITAWHEDAYGFYGAEPEASILDYAILSEIDLKFAVQTSQIGPIDISSIKTPTVFGTDEGDELLGTGVMDCLKGRKGDDTLDAFAGNDSLYGMGGNDKLRGAQGNDLIYGGSGVDQLFGGSGKDVLNGDDGADIAKGGENQDIIRGGKGSDILFGGNGADELYGGKSNDKFYGGTSADEIFGGSGADKIYGGNGQDDIFGSHGYDDIYGGGSADTIRGGNGRDEIFGGKGDDEIYGNAGHDTLDGGSGADIFVFKTNHDQDTILNFSSSSDTLRLDQGLWSGTLTAQQVVNSFATTSGGNTVLDFGNGNSITIDGFTNLNALADTIDFV